MPDALHLLEVAGPYLATAVAIVISIVNSRSAKFDKIAADITKTGETAETKATLARATLREDMATMRREFQEALHGLRLDSRAEHNALAVQVRAISEDIRKEYVRVVDLAYLRDDIRDLRKEIDNLHTLIVRHHGQQ